MFKSLSISSPESSSFSTSTSFIVLFCDIASFAISADLSYPITGTRAVTNIEFFYIFSFIAIFSAIMVTVSKNTVHSVFFLILDFISISFLFIMIGAEFLGMIMLIVYVGAVAILFLFVVMMLNVAQQKNEWFS